MNIFSVASDIQDIEHLMSNAETALRQWEKGKIPVLDLSIMIGESTQLTQNTQRLKSQWNINSWSIIQSTRPVLGPWVIWFQQFVRKFTWWYLEPIIQQIRIFQMNTSTTVDKLAKNQEKLLHQLEKMDEELTFLKKQIDNPQPKLRHGDESNDAA